MKQSALGLFGRALLQDAMEASKESLLRLCLPDDGPRSVARLGVSGDVTRVLHSACA